MLLSVYENGVCYIVYRYEISVKLSSKRICDIPTIFIKIILLNVWIKNITKKYLKNLRFKNIYLKIITHSFYTNFKKSMTMGRNYSIFLQIS